MSDDYDDEHVAWMILGAAVVLAIAFILALGFK